MTFGKPRFANEAVSTNLEIPVRSGVTLRELDIEDAPALFSLISRSGEHLGQFGETTAAKYPTIESVETQYREKDTEVKRFGIWDEDTLVGFVNLQHRTSYFAEIGYWLGKDHTHKGYMVDSVEALSNHAIGEWGYEEVIAVINPENIASKKVLGHAGYEDYGIQPTDPPTQLFGFTERKIKVETRKHRDARKIITLAANHGAIEATIDSSGTWMSIANIDVELHYRRLGIAKDLLRRSLEYAENMGVSKINAGIVSRECIDAMVSVFGEDAVHIGTEGSYAPDHNPNHRDASAALYFTVPRLAVEV